MTRRLFLDRGPGETRGVVVLDGRPERLLIERDDEVAVQRRGAVAIARVRKIERGLGSAFLDMGEGPDAILPLAAGLHEGAAVEVEIVAEARRGKGAQARLLGPAEGAPRLTRSAPTLLQRLRAFAPQADVAEGAQARAAADVAEAAVLAVEHPLGGGASLAIEPTRALVAVDVDVGAAAGGDRRRAEAKVNREALAEGARLLRLKGLAGLVVFDLVGRGQDGPWLLRAAEEAFAPDQPGVAFGPVTRFGTFQLALPWRDAPVAERLLDADGRPSVATIARRLARVVEAEARRATRVTAVCALDVAEAAAGQVLAALVERLGPRVDILAEPARTREDFDVRGHA